MEAGFSCLMRSILGIYFFVTAFGLATGVTKQVLTKTLHDELFSEYDTNLIPICNEGENVTVRIDIAIRQVMELDEPRQILKTNAWIRLRWNDCRLSWKRYSFGNLTHISVYYDDIWFPDITLVDSATDKVMLPGRESFSAQITSTGSIFYNFPTILTSICQVNVRYFPFDSQRCPLSFASWSYHGLLLDVINKNPHGDTYSFVANSEWDMQGLPAERKVIYYKCCSEPFPDVTFYVILQRRPIFYALTMLFPCILVSFVSALTFILPAESGEKVSLDITVLLSLAVFLLVVSEVLPPASDSFPIIGSYFAASMVLVSVSLLQTVLIVNVFHRGANGRRVPRWLKTVCFQYIAQIFFVKPNIPGNDDHYIDEKLDKWKESSLNPPSVTNNEIRLRPEKTEETGESHINQYEENAMNPRFLSRTTSPFAEEPSVKLLRELNGKLNVITNMVIQKSQEDDINSEWRDVANIFDRVFLVFYCLVTLATTLAFLLQCIQ